MSKHTVIPIDNMSISQRPGFLDLTEKVLEEILEYLEYCEVVQLRLVCRCLNVLSSRVLNTAFLALKPQLETLLQEAKSDVAGSHFRLKVLRILRMELALLHAVCGHYVTSGKAVFTGGSILDAFWFALQHEKIESELTITLFFLIEDFMDYFEDVIEPCLCDALPTSRFGTKIIDVVSCYLNSNYQLIVTYDDAACHLAGIIETTNTLSMDCPPIICGLCCQEPTASDLKTLVRFLRNNVHWNNLLICIDDTCIEKEPITDETDMHKNSVIKNQDVIATGDFFGSSLNVKQKIFKRRMETTQSSEGIIVTVDMQCPTELVPLFFMPHLKDFHAMKKANISKRARHKRRVLGQECQPLAKSYEFCMQLKVRHRVVNDQLKEALINLYQTKENVIATQCTRDVGSLDRCKGKGGTHETAVTDETDPQESQ